MSRPRILARESRLYENYRQPKLELAFSGTGGAPREADIRVTRDGVAMPFVFQSAPPFPLPGKTSARYTWYYFELFPRLPLPTGSHRLLVEWKDSAGTTRAKRTIRLLIDLAAPRIEFLAPGKHEYVSAQTGAEWKVDDGRKSDAVLRSPSDLSAVGTTKAEYLQLLDVERIEDLLRLDMATVYSPRLERGEILNMVTRARFINKFSFSKRRFESLLDETLARLAFMSIADIRNHTKVRESQAARFLRDARLLHAFFDLSVSHEMTLREFIKRPPSRLNDFKIFLDGIDVSDQGRMTKDRLHFHPTSPVADGEHTLRAVVTDRAGNRDEATRHYKVDATPPALEILSPSKDGYYAEKNISFSARFKDVGSGMAPESLKLKLDGKDVTKSAVIASDGIEAPFDNLAQGTHVFRLECSDAVGNLAAVEHHITIDTKAPVVTLTSPENQTVTEAAAIEVQGSVEETNPREARLGEELIEIQSDGTFRLEVPLRLGANFLRVEVVDRAGNRGSSADLTVHRLDTREAGFSGVIRGGDGGLLAGVSVRDPKSGAAAVTDAAGRFHFSALPDGDLLLNITPPDSNHLPLTLPVRLEYGRSLIRENPITLLPKLSGTRKKKTAAGTVISNSGAPGLELRHENDIEFDLPPGVSGGISIGFVDSANLPYALPGFIPEGKLARLEPSGLRVKNGASIQLTLPNSIGADPDATLPVITYDEARGRWYTGAMAKVSEDGTKIETLPEMGIRHFSLAAVAPPGAHVEVLDESSENPGPAAHKGGLETTLALPGFTYQGRAHVPALVYNSLTAAPQARVSAVFRGLREIQHVRTVVDHLAADIQQMGKRILPRYVYETYRRYRRVYDPRFPPHRNVYGLRPVNEFMYRETVELPPLFVPEGGPGIALPAPETAYYYELESRPVADFTRVRDVTFYEIKIRNKVERLSGLWPESIIARYWFSDQDSGDFTIHGPLVKIGPEPREGEEDTREEFPRLYPDTVLTYTMSPRGPAGEYYPTGLYNFFARYRIDGRSYSATRSAVIAEKFQVSSEWLQSIYEDLARKAGVTPYYNSVGHHTINQDSLAEHIAPLLHVLSAKERENMQRLLDVIRKGHELFWYGPDYESRFEYGDPLNLLMKNQSGSAIIHNLTASSLGRGWRLRELQEVHAIGRSRALLIDSSGPRVFTIADRIEKVRAGSYGLLARNAEGTVIAAMTLPAEHRIMDIDRLTSHGDAVGTTIYNIISSAAFSESHPSDHDFIQAVFRGLVGREATTEEAAHWIDKKTENASIAVFTRQFLESELFRFAFAGEMIKLILDREPREGELKTFGDLAQVHLTYFNADLVLVGLLTSDEFSNRYPEDEDFVEIVFRELTIGWDLLPEIVRKNTVSSYARVLKGKTRAVYLERYVLSKFPVQYRFARRYLKSLMNAEPYRANGFHLLRAGDATMEPSQIQGAKFTRTTRKYRQQRFSPQHSFTASPRPPGQVVQTEILQDEPAAPAGMVVADDGSFYVSDAGTHRIYLVTPASPEWTALGSSTMPRAVLGYTRRESKTRLQGEYHYFDAAGNQVKSSTSDIAAGQETHITYREYTETFEQSTGSDIAQAGFSPDGTYMQTGQRGEAVAMPVSLHAPGGLAMDAEGRLIFAETGNHLIRRFNLETRELTTILGTGRPEYRPGLYDKAPVNLRAPLDIALTKQGDLYVLFHPVGEQQAVARFDRNGRFTHVAGSPYAEVGTIDTGVDAKYYKLLGAVAIDVNELGEIFIAVKDQNRVLVVTREGRMDVVAGDGTAVALTGDGGPSLQASVAGPRGLTLDFAGNVLVSDTGHNSLRLVSNGVNDGHAISEFVGPRGYYDSRLTRKRDGSWERVYKNGLRALFNDRGRQSALVDRNGNTTEYHYEHNRPVRVNYPGGARLELEYQDDKLRSITDHAGRRTEFNIAEGMLTEVTQADDSKLKFAYDQDGRLTSALAPDAPERTFQYDDEGRLISGETGFTMEPPPDGARIAATRERALTVGANSAQTSISTSDESVFTRKIEHGRLTEYRRGGMGLRIHYSAGLLPILIERSTGSRLELEYNDHGDLIRMRDSFLDAEKTASMNLLRLPAAEKDYQGFTREFIYDARGNLRATEKAGLRILTQSRDEQGLVTRREVGGTVAEYEYDGNGNLKTETSGGIQYGFQRDAAGNIVRESRGDYPPRMHEYDAWNRLIKVEEARGTTTYAYDDRGRMRLMRTPVGGEHKYEYNESGDLIALTLPEDRTWRFTYDDQRRMLAKTDPGGRETNYFHDQGIYQEEETQDELVEKEFAADGSLKWARNGAAEFLRKFDEAGRHISEETLLVNQVRVVVERRLDDDGRLLALRSDDFEIAYAYDERGWLRNIQAGDFQLNISRDKFGRPARVTGPGDLTFETTHGDSGRVTGMLARAADGVLYENTLRSDSAGNPTQVNANGRVVSYEYDADEQLISENSVRTYEYDALGNRNRDTSGAYTYNADGSLAEDPRYRYAYDSAGRVERRVDKNDGRVHHCRYNHRGQLRQYRVEDGGELPVLRATYGYDARGRRVYKRVVHRDSPFDAEVRYFVYHGDDVLLELDEDLKVARQYIPGVQIDGHLGFLEGDNIYYYGRDCLGNVTHVVDGDGKIACEYEYDAFGALLKEEETVANRFRYRGREWDAESGMYYYRYRAYDPAAGRFLQPDPAPGQQNRPLSMINPRVYAWNNPLRYSDPLGLMVRSLSLSPAFNDPFWNFEDGPGTGDKAGIPGEDVPAPGAGDKAGIPGEDVSGPDAYDGWDFSPSINNAPSASGAGSSSAFRDYVWNLELQRALRDNERLLAGGPTALREGLQRALDGFRVVSGLAIPTGGPLLNGADLVARHADPAGAGTQASLPSVFLRGVGTSLPAGVPELAHAGGPREATNLRGEGETKEIFVADSKSWLDQRFKELDSLAKAVEKDPSRWPEILDLVGRMRSNLIIKKREAGFDPKDPDLADALEKAFLAYQASSAEHREKTKQFQDLTFELFSEQGLAGIFSSPETAKSLAEEIKKLETPEYRMIPRKVFDIMYMLRFGAKLEKNGRMSFNTGGYHDDDENILYISEPENSAFTALDDEGESVAKRNARGLLSLFVHETVHLITQGNGLGEGSFFSRRSFTEQAYSGEEWSDFRDGLNALDEGLDSYLTHRLIQSTSYGHPDMPVHGYPKIVERLEKLLEKITDRPAVETKLLELYLRRTSILDIGEFIFEAADFDPEETEQKIDEWGRDYRSRYKNRMQLARNKIPKIHKDSQWSPDRKESTLEIEDCFIIQGDGVKMKVNIPDNLAKQARHYFFDVVNVTNGKVSTVYAPQASLCATATSVGIFKIIVTVAASEKVLLSQSRYIDAHVHPKGTPIPPGKVPCKPCHTVA